MLNIWQWGEGEWEWDGAQVIERANENDDKKRMGSSDHSRTKVCEKKETNRKALNLLNECFDESNSAQIPTNTLATEYSTHLSHWIGWRKKRNSEKG